MLIPMIKRQEGLRLKPYKCSANKLTIGYGRNIEDVGITEAEAEGMLMGDIANCLIQLSVLPYFDTLDSVRRDVLTDMCFQLGFSGLLKFKKIISQTVRSRQ